MWRVLERGYCIESLQSAEGQVNSVHWMAKNILSASASLLEKLEALGDLARAMSFLPTWTTQPVQSLNRRWWQDRQRFGFGVFLRHLWVKAATARVQVSSRGSWKTQMMPLVVKNINKGALSSTAEDYRTVNLKKNWWAETLIAYLILHLRTN